MGFINVTVKGGGDVGYYGRSTECTKMVWRDEGESSLQVLNERWSKIEQDEKFGKKELGIQGRKDAQVRKNYVLTMPNSLTPGQCVQRVQNIIQKTDIKNCNYSIFVHAGKKNGITNQHVHLLVNERDLTTMKKNREMQKKKWLEEVFRKAYLEEFKIEFEIAQKQDRRERIPVNLYESDVQVAKNALKPLNKPKSNFYIVKKENSWQVFEKEETKTKMNGDPPMIIFLKPLPSFSIHHKFVIDKKEDELKDFLKSEEPEMYKIFEESEIKKNQESLSKMLNLKSQIRR